jgi:pimeloyl-ACP methyl ester carboxylesterase
MIEPSEITLHGHKLCYRTCGSGPVLMLVHGITNSSASWEPVMPQLGEHFTIIAPDLLGHGDSAKPRGDYSLGASASLLRDLLLALGHDSATLVGHSLGGGIAMQFVYQFPERVERLVLVASGGLGREVTSVLRAATLPGSELVLPLLASQPVLTAGSTAGRWLSAIGLKAGSAMTEVAHGFASLHDVDTRRAFVHTARAVMDFGGQRINAFDRLYLSQAVPTLLVWGDRDPVIPVRHAIRAHEEMPGSRLRIFEGAKHFPHHDDPDAFSELLRDFVETTEPAEPDDGRLRRLVLERIARDEQAARERAALEELDALDEAV